MKTSKYQKGRDQNTFSPVGRFGYSPIFIVMLCLMIAYRISLGKYFVEVQKQNLTVSGLLAPGGFINFRCDTGIKAIYGYYDGTVSMELVAVDASSRERVVSFLQARPVSKGRTLKEKRPPSPLEQLLQARERIGDRPSPNMEKGWADGSRYDNTYNDVIKVKPSEEVESKVILEERMYIASGMDVKPDDAVLLRIRLDMVYPSLKFKNAYMDESYAKQDTINLPVNTTHPSGIQRLLILMRKYWIYMSIVSPLSILYALRRWFPKTYGRLKMLVYDS